MRGILIIVFLALSACSLQKGPVMTVEGYQNIQIGMSEETLVKTFGPPHSTSHRDSGVVIYEYIERFEMVMEGQTEQSIIEMRRYYFFIKDGIVVSKHMRLYDRPGYEPMNQLP